jgi:DNA mismatch repair protein MutS
MALIKEYFELTKNYQEEYGENTILLMQVGAFFEVYGIIDKKTNIIHGSKIIDFSQICELSVVDKNVCVGNENIMMAGFKDFQIEKYIKKIQESGFTTVVYTQDEATKNTKRSLAGIFSPGTYFSNDTKNLTNNLTCIWVDLIENNFLMKGKFVVVGVSNIDIYTGKTTMFQFKEIYFNNPTTYDELERFISIYNPSEVIFISNLPDKEVEDVINFTNIHCNLIHKVNLNIPNEKQYLQAKNCEKQVYQKEILNKFYKIHDFDVFYHNFHDNIIAAQSFCYLLDFVFQHNPYLVNKISEPIFENCSDRLILANHSLKQLNIIDGDNYSGKYSSVLKILNGCLTPMGKRKFIYHFLNPTTNIVFLEKEYQITDYLLQMEETYTFLKNDLSVIKDISKWERQVFLKKISPKSFYQLYNNIVSIKKIYEVVIKDSIIKEYLSSFEKNIKEIGLYCENILTFINENINLELAKDIDSIQSFEINFIQYGIDNELDKKTELLQNSELKLEAIKNYLSSVIENKEKKNSKSNDYVKIHETEKNNYSLLTTNRRCKLLQDALPIDTNNVFLTYPIKDNNNNNNTKNFHLKISKNQFTFEKQSASNNYIIDEQINTLCKNISSTKIGLKDLITFVFNKFVEKMENYQKELQSIINFITVIDLIYNKMSIAKKYNYCKPVLYTGNADKSFISAKGIRHCLIEHIQTNELYVTNDVELGTGIIDGLLLYGTNAVGKTSFIKAIGIAIIMAQSGLYVPCSEFTYKPYKYLFTRILGNDNIFKGLSTFAVEMSELRTILKRADENSLILGDELCSGTENTSAISIFVAGIQKLHQCRSSFIFATHLHEIVNYDEIKSLSNVFLKHMAVIYDKEKDMLIYDRKLKDGPGNSMYGLEVCKSLNLPEDFLTAAYNIRIKYQPETGSLLSLKTSHYNSKKIMNLCEKCGENIGSEVHHLQYQKEANENGIINKESTFHKNNIANLMTLCETCHREIHKTFQKGSKRVKTSKGYALQTI